MSAGLAVLVLVAGMTVFLGSLVYLRVFLRSRQAIGDILRLQQRALVAARIDPKEAQEELAAILGELRERMPVVKHPAREFPDRTPDIRATRFSGRS